MVESTFLGHVLVAVGDPIFGEATASLLRGEGFTCDAAADGAAAEGLLGAGDYDIVIADTGLAGNAGLELISALARAPGCPPVILVTDTPSMDTAARSIMLPVVAYLVKPVPPQELLQHARAAAGLAQGQRQARRLDARLRRWLQDLAVVQGTMAAGVDDPAQSLGLFVRLTLQYMAGCMSDVLQMTRILSMQGPDAGQPVTLLRAVEGAIQVLENSRKHFKSRELADLRQKLEQVLADYAGH